jgi:NADH:ubiquinone oxidoreductase subunit 4 (subunit M)
MIIALLLVPIIGVLFLLPMAPSTLLNVSNTSHLSVQPSLHSPIGGKVISDSDTLNKKNSVEKMKQIALFFSLINFFISIIMWYQFDFNSSTYQFVYEFNQLNFCHFHVGIDGISLYFVLLTTFITPICILSN